MNILRCFKEVNKDIAEAVDDIDFKEGGKWLLSVILKFAALITAIFVMMTTTVLGSKFSTIIGFPDSSFINSSLTTLGALIGLCINLYLVFVYLKYQDLRDKQ